MKLLRTLRSKVTVYSVSADTHLSYRCVFAIPVVSTSIESSLARPCSVFANVFSTFCASNVGKPVASESIKGLNVICSDNEGSDGENECDGDDGGFMGRVDSSDEVVHDAKRVASILSEAAANRLEMKNKIEQCGVTVTKELVLEVIARVRNDWEAAFTFFIWAGKQPDYTHSVREYHGMISILGKFRKFDTAWALIDEMRGVKIGVPLVNSQTLLIMIRKYCAVHDVGRAINTFYAYKRFGFEVGMDDFQSLLSALCRYKNVQDAEHLMFCNGNVFPFNTKSFNIVLNGWCNVIGSSCEAERVWREMGKRGIRYDVVSYASIISCYSKANKLYKVLKLYDRMKQVGIEPDRKVYNAVIHAFAKGGLVKEAINLMKTMEELGIRPNIVTYNSLIKPLCKARKLDEARGAFDEMLQRGIVPTIRTYHAFLRIARTGEEVFDLLERMRSTGCQPTNDTYVMLIRKFCRWRQLDNVLKLWDEMIEKGISPDQSSYMVLIHGLFLNGEVETAYRFYIEMKAKQLLPDPKMEEMLQTWFSNRQIVDQQIIESKQNHFQESKSYNCPAVSKKTDDEKDFLQQAETKKVVRERGFSFWES